MKLRDLVEKPYICGGQSFKKKNVIYFSPTKSHSVLEKCSPHPLKCGGKDSDVASGLASAHFRLGIPSFETCWYLTKKYMWRALNLESICLVEWNIDETICVSDIFCFNVVEWRFIQIYHGFVNYTTFIVRVILSYGVTSIWLLYVCYSDIDVVYSMCVCLCLKDNIRIWLYTSQGYFLSWQQRPWWFDRTLRQALWGKNASQS